MYLSTKTKSSSCSIHSYVTTADNNNFLSGYDRCVVVIAESFHQVTSCQVFICGEDTVGYFTRDTHEHRQTRTGSDKYCFEPFIFHQFIYSSGFTDDNVGVDLNTERFYIFNFCFYNFIFWQTEFRNTVNQNTTSLMQCFKDSYIVTKFCQISCTGQTGRTGTDNCNFMTVFLCRSFRFDTVFFGPVSYKTLQFTDGYRFAFDTTDTFSFTLCFLWTYTTTDCRQCTGLSDYFVCFCKVTFLHFFNERRNIDTYRTSLNTFGIFTGQTSGSLFHSFFFVISKTYFIKVCCSYFRCLLSYRYFF